jgi:insulysin
MTEQEYQTRVQALIDKILEKPKNLSQETSRYWGQINSGYYDFEQGKKEKRSFFFNDLSLFD